MTDRRAERDRQRRERRKAREAEERRREERNRARRRRSEELWEAWRRNHPGEEEGDKDGPQKGRHTYPPQALAGGFGVRDDGDRLGR